MPDVVRLYANENFPRPVVLELRRLGYDVLTIAETGRAEQAISDPEVLRFATEDRRAVLNLNRRHFVRLHQETPEHGGIIVCTFDPDFPGQAQRIHESVSAAGALHGQLLRVNRATTAG